MFQRIARRGEYPRKASPPRRKRLPKIRGLRYQAKPPSCQTLFSQHALPRFCNPLTPAVALTSPAPALLRTHLRRCRSFAFPLRLRLQQVDQFQSAPRSSSCFCFPCCRTPSATAPPPGAAHVAVFDVLHQRIGKMHAFFFDFHFQGPPQRLLRALVQLLILAVRRPLLSSLCAEPPLRRPRRSPPTSLFSTLPALPGIFTTLPLVFFCFFLSRLLGLDLSAIPATRPRTSLRRDRVIRRPRRSGVALRSAISHGSPIADSRGLVVCRGKAKGATLSELPL